MVMPEYVTLIWCGTSFACALCMVGINLMNLAEKLGRVL
jgi:hypothetical protein